MSYFDGIQLRMTRGAFLRKVKVAIVDSGISSNLELMKVVSEQYGLRYENDKVEMKLMNCEDDVGHGSAIADIIYKTNPEVEILTLKISSQQAGIDCDDLCVALRFVLDNLDVELVNISAGITYVDDYEKLKQICDELERKGIIVVSAFDNNGAVSYPAAFNSVIGVDISDEFQGKKELIRLHRACADLIVPNQFYRTVWLNGEKTILKGTSFACAKVTGILSKKLAEFEQGSIDKEKLMDLVKTQDYSMLMKEGKEKEKIEIKKAIVFPVNKETHSLLRFRDLLTFELVGVYDEKLDGLVGKELFGMTIQSFDTINWDDDFDTIILSCTTALSKLTRKDYQGEVVCLAKEHGKSIYTFEEIQSADENIFYPDASNIAVPYRNMNKLHKISMPVIGVFGTSQSQGKFTVQLELKRRLSNMGYQVGQLATEPSGYLFGAQHVYHFGYHAKINIGQAEMIALLNEMIWDIEKQGNDIAITGCQSATLHYDNSSIQDLSLQQQNFLFGVLPDFFVLCVNPHDDINYIKRTIQYLNAIDIGKVYAIAVYPIKVEESMNGIQLKKRTLTHEEMNEFKKYIHEQCMLPAFEIANAKDMDSLCELVVETLSEEV